MFHKLPEFSLFGFSGSREREIERVMDFDALNFIIGRGAGSYIEGAVSKFSCNSLLTFSAYLSCPCSVRSDSTSMVSDKVNKSRLPSTEMSNNFSCLPLFLSSDNYLY